MQEKGIRRRNFLKSFAAGSAAGWTSAAAAAASAQEIKVKGRIQQSVCRGNWRDYPWDEFLPACKEMGLVGVDLVGQGDWPAIKKHGMIATMCPGAGSIKNGLNNKNNHPRFLNDFKKNIQAAAGNGWRNVITMAGDRRGVDDEEGMENCRLILQEAVKMAEDSGVTICMELLNSKVDHPGYMCDHTAWGVELCKRVASPHFKLLYDIYHMQIMEGDIIRTIRTNIDYIGHFHTAGNPGRKDLDDRQELQYKPIMEAIADLTEQGKYNGFVAHEFGPKHKLDSLRQAVQICDV
ncbi:MAG: TIM barrel protein [Candidatus Omnitrophica bacterium]|nr:TIM barrel protein [Candidatus Omnitrophota bacterium]